MRETTLVIRLKNFASEDVRDVDTKVTLMYAAPNHGRTDTQVHRRRFFDGEETFKIESPAHARWTGWVDADRYERRGIESFRLTNKSPIEQEIYLPRNELDDWAPEFDPWSDLDESLQKLLERSSDLRLKIRGKKNLESLEWSTKEAYDRINVNNREHILGRSGLLNLYAKLNSLKLPDQLQSQDQADRTWLTYIKRLLGVQRDRIVGVVDKKMAKAVKQIHKCPGDYSDYNSAPVGHHYKKNIKPLIPETYSSDNSSEDPLVEAYSIKSREKIGVLQLVIAKIRKDDGKFVYMLDADIDENGNLLKHFGDVIKHQFNGGTHPYHVYDILHFIEKPPSAYRLV